MLEGLRIKISGIYFLIEEELQIMLLKKYKLNYHIKGYHDGTEPNTQRIYQGLIRPDFLFLKRKNWSIRKNYFVISLWRQ